jgi:hypothetical protein
MIRFFDGDSQVPGKSRDYILLFRLAARQRFQRIDNRLGLFCCFGYSFGTIEIAPDGQASAQSPQPMHLSTSIILFSVSVAPVGQT